MDCIQGYLMVRRDHMLEKRLETIIVLALASEAGHSSVWVLDHGPQAAKQSVLLRQVEILKVSGVKCFQCHVLGMRLTQLEQVASCGAASVAAGRVLGRHHRSHHGFRLCLRITAKFHLDLRPIVPSAWVFWLGFKCVLEGLQGVVKLAEGLFYSLHERDRVFSQKYYETMNKFNMSHEQMQDAKGLGLESVDDLKVEMDRIKIYCIATHIMEMTRIRDNKDKAKIQQYCDRLIFSKYQGDQATHAEVLQANMKNKT